MVKNTFIEYYKLRKGECFSYIFLKYGEGVFNLKKKIKSKNGVKTAILEKSDKEFNTYNIEIMSGDTKIYKGFNMDKNDIVDILENEGFDTRKLNL